VPFRTTSLRRALVLVATGLAVSLAAGCGGGGGGSANIANGREIFANGTGGNQACAYCHTLRAANAGGTFAPNLDQDIAEDRRTGMSESKIDKEVLGLIREGVCLDQNDPSRCMPKGLASGGDAEDVAAFVARCADNPRGQDCSEAPPADALVAKGRRLFGTLRCQGCHSTNGNVAVAPTFKGLAGSEVTLSDGGTTTATDSYLLTSIIVPDALIVDGYKPGFMSTTIRPRQVSVAQARALIAYMKTLK
jgi:mono/diheme cytochrome c family protein